jgi:hypothetical protein
MIAANGTYLTLEIEPATKGALRSPSNLRRVTHDHQEKAGHVTTGSKYAIILGTPCSPLEQGG